MKSIGTWNTKYWDIMEQIYWSPKYIGLRSIPQSTWRISDEGMVCIPKEFLNRTGPLYARGNNEENHRRWMVQQEEILNHVFDITFAIAPDALIEACFSQPFGMADQGPYRSLGREVRQRYGWTKSENVTLHDGLFISDRSIFGVEIKLRSRSSSSQILKYASLFAWEEMRTGVREQLGLLYILQNPADSTHWRQCGLDGSQISSNLLETVDATQLPKRIRDLVMNNREALVSVLDRMDLTSITWTDLRSTCVEFCSKLDTSQPGNQTLIRLVEGLVAQINEQVPS